MNITGLSKETFENLQIEAGAAFKNLEITKQMTPAQFKTLLEAARKDPEKVIGATDGGFNFVAAAETRQPAVDGLGAGVKGLNIVSSVNVQLSFTSREITPENWALSIGNASIEDAGTGHKVIVPRFQYDDESYIPDVTFVGMMGDGKTIVAVTLLNVLNTTGVNFQSTNSGEGGFTYELHAHLEDPWSDTPPYLVHYFEVAGGIDGFSHPSLED